MRAVIVALLLATIGGCSCAIQVTATGSLDQGITFTFPEAKAVYYAGVRVRGAMKEDGMREWRDVWRAEGKDRVDHIRYGEGTGGLSSRIAASALEQGRLYEFQVEARDGFGTPCVGRFEFVVGANGSVEECHDGQECRRGIP